MEKHITTKAAPLFCSAQAHEPQLRSADGQAHRMTDLIDGAGGRR